MNKDNTLIENFKEEVVEIFTIIKENKVATIFTLLILFLTLSYYLITSPLPNPNEVIVEIENGTSVKEASKILKENKIIRSESIFNTAVQFSDKKIIGAGTYMFSEPENVFVVVKRLTNAEYGIPLIDITLSEGLTVEQMADRLNSNLENFDSKNFIKLATKYEGYLFPDTYRFSILSDEYEVIKLLRDNFDFKITPLREEINNSEKTLDEIITMASIVEKEADRDSIQEVSNILWHRMSIDMPLQVDATFVYSINKHSFTVTKEEMRDDSNLYNTYTHLGLPPSPISNPGLESINASLNPELTDNLYFFDWSRRKYVLCDRF